MKVLQISSAESFGGGEKHLLELCEGLQAEGIDTSFAIRPSCGWKQRMADVSPSGVHEIALRGSADVLSAFRIARTARYNGYDLMHCHLARDYVPCAIASRLSGVPFIATRHVLFDISIASRIALRQASAVIAVSSGVGARLAGFLPADRIAVIPNGLDFAELDPDKRRENGAAFRRDIGIDTDAKLLVTVGELSDVKNQRDIVLAAAELKKKIPSCFLLLVGSDNSQGAGYRRSLRRLVKVMSIEDDVRFLDWVEETDHLLAAADVFVSSSKSESFGLAILEAMAAGTPVVSTSTEGANELLAGGECGVLVALEDPVALAEGMFEVLSSPERSGETANKARERALTEYSFGKMVKQTAAVYRKVQSD